MKKPNPFINQLINDINWLYEEAPDFFKWFITIIIVFSVLSTFAEPKRVSVIDLYNNNNLIEDNQKIIGYICSNGDYFTMNELPNDKCICENYYLKYWVVDSLTNNTQ
jgi:uncharacterized ubiquitin-like protein YukD